MHIPISRWVAIIISLVLTMWVGCKSTDSKDASIDANTDVEKDASDASDADATSQNGNGKPITPKLKSITATEAEKLGAYARKLECASQGNPLQPVAWSMVNVSCQDRLMALAYAVAAADPALTDAPPPMRDTEMTVKRIEELADNPSFDAATINVAGPLVTYQTLIKPNGKTIGTQPLEYYWSYHHALVINVEGKLRVLDLSTGDSPLPIDDWLSGFVDPSIKCVHSSDEVHQQVWVYWNSAFGNFELPEEPSVLCAYTITPLFTMRRDQTPSDLADFISFVPATMETLLGSFKTTLSATYGVTLAEEVLPNITSSYSPGMVEDVCNWTHMQFCF